IIASNANTDASNNLASNAGAAYVFTRTGADTWTQRAYLKASNADADDQFATALAISSDGGVIAAGAFEEDGDANDPGTPAGDHDSIEDSGAAYVFVRSGDNWNQEQYLKARNARRLDWFGASVALSGAGDTLAIGATFEDALNGVTSGRV